ncbi:MAG: FG-GAP-like repeat-containing protein, partial [Acidobacteriaceae bacterium]
MKSRWFFAPLLCVTVAIAVVAIFSAMERQAIRAQRENLMAASLQYPKFTLAQHMAVLRAHQAQRNPKWQDLSLAEVAHRLFQMATSSVASDEAPLANFTGNLTGINVPGGDLLTMFRQPNCSLTVDWASFMLSFPSGTYTIAGTTPNYDQVLHNAAGLTTTGGKWPSGCGDAVLGITSRKLAFLGTTSSKDLVIAAAGFDFSTQEQVIFTFVGPVTSDTVSIGVIPISGESPTGLVAANLTGATSGISDLIAVSESSGTTGTGSISVIPVDATGTFGSPTQYSLPGTQGLSAVVDDFNGDGKLDIVATSMTFVTGGSIDYELTYLQGNGDGTFQTPVSVTLSPPAGVMAGPYYGLISADLLANGKKDLVTSAGLVLLGNGNGTFTQSTTLAFPTPTSTSEYGPNVVAADFNNDGKLDLAEDNGESIQVYLGKGDGTFTTDGGYAAIDNTGYLFATDLDGDGNTDLFSGLARGGGFGGDQFEMNQAYALMGNGDGTFRGAPEMPFVFTGTNLTDLNGDGIPDGVGVDATLNSSNVSMTSYLGKANGSFTVAQTLAISPVTIGGTSVSFSSLDSFGLGDVNGDGKPDLVYLPTSFYAPGGVTGYFLATGEGNGSFNTPVFITAAPFLPAGAPSNDFDDSETLSNLFVADMNGDGKADLVYNYSAVDYYLNTYVQGIAVQLSNGDGTFQAPKTIQTYSSTTAPPPLQPLLVQVAATRASGVRDVFVLLESLSNGTITTQLELYLGNGDGTFGAATMPPVADNVNPPTYGTIEGQIVLADMNGDGKPDLITLGSTADNAQAELAISLGNGDGTFQKPAILNFGGGSSLDYGLAAADFNGDGKVDVAVTGFNPPVDTGIFLGNGDGTVQTFNASNGLVEPSEAIDLVLFGASQAIDFNGDGKPDLVGGQGILLNLGATSTLLPTTTSLNSSATNVSFGTSLTLTATVTGTPTPTGSVTFYDGANTLGTGTLNASGVATYTTTTLSVGVHSLTASFPASSTYSGSTSGAVNVTVTTPTLIATTSTLAASSTTVNSGASVTLTDTVAPNSGTGTPTGMVNFISGGVTLASNVALTNGAATYVTSSLPLGANTIIAIYAGSSSYSGSTSNSIVVTVQTVPPTFTIGASPSSATVNAGQSTQTTITVSPAGGFNSQVSFACTGLPTGGSCTFNPTTVTPNGTMASTTMLTIATAA